jgi:surface polysaccharide O-acyltransferase-like enzyme
MMLTHAALPYRLARGAFFIWDFSHFSVPIFVFCSLYLFFAKPHALDLKGYFLYLKKRLVRLIIPFYWYVAAFFLLSFTIGRVRPDIDHLKYLLPWSGPEGSWLIILFFYMTVLAPLVLYVYRKSKFWTWVLFLVSAASTVYFLFVRPPNYLLLMWLPWTSVMLFVLFFVNYISKKDKRLFVTGMSLFVLFLVLRSYLASENRTLILINHKYPPDIYYFAYGMSGLVATYWLVTKGLFGKLKMEKILHFFSVNSLSLYFIHNLVIYSLDKLNIRFGYWPLYFLVIVSASAAVQSILNNIKMPKKIKADVPTNGIPSGKKV